MKSDDEFIAGIYEKAEERRRENEKPETDTGERKQLLRFRPRTWRWLTAAACLCILGGAVLAGAAAGKSRTEHQPAPQAELALLPASLAAEDNPRVRSTEKLTTVRGTVKACGTEEPAAVLQMTNEETGREFSAVLQCGVKPEAGDEIILILNEEPDGYYLTDASRYYRKESDGLYYNAQGGIFSENTGGE